MSNEYKHPLQNLLESLEMNCSSYSGRGMMGKHCLSVDLRDCTLGNFFATILSEVDDNDKDEVAEAFEDMKTDSLGKGMVVYFPKVTYEEGDGESDDGEDNED